MDIQLIRLDRLITTFHIPSTQGTNQAGTSHQEAALIGNDDV